MGRLYSLELEDFKSFKGKHLIGPFRQFSAIVGPNGSGKSNLMDAISFVLGEKSNNLRVRRLGDLIHGASVDKAQSNKCRVTMNYLLDDEEKTIKTFTRSVVSSLAGEFRIDNVVVTQVQYRQELEGINIFIKAKNFLVYQGAVEQIAMQSPKELTQLFEELSRSSEFQDEYDRLRAEVEAAETNAQTNLNKRRDIALEKREARMEAGEAKKYQNLKDELAAKNRELYMVQLYFVEYSRESAKKQLLALRDQVESTRISKQECDENVSKKASQVKNLVREVTKLEHKVTREDRKVAQQEPIVTQLKQQMGHLKSKKETAEKAYLSAQKVAEEYEKTVTDAKSKMAEIRKKKDALAAEIEKESQNRELNLNPEQIAEYRRLKTRFEKTSMEETQKLDNKRQEQETDRNAVEYEKRRLGTHIEKIRQKEAEIEREKKNIERLKAAEKEQKEMLQKGKIDMVNYEKEVKESKEQLEKATIDLAEVSKQIADAHGDSAETERAKRQNEAIESLKRVFPEKVHGRLVDLCQPSHKRFQIAVTKILGKYMAAIVCDTDETARDCISYLREQHFSPETFLPLSTLDVLPLNEKLREITNPPNVKLCYDVINCNLPIARKALQFACGNSLVCDTPENARQLAYGTERGDRNRAVALDGTQFQPNGVISGGGADLKVRARKWDEHAIKKLKDRRNQLQEECNTLHRTRRRELDVEIKRNQLNTLEARIKSTHNECKKLEEQGLERLKLDLEAAMGEISVIEERIAMLEEQMQQRLAEIQELERHSDQIADEIFAEFCATVGIRHIREYEQREMKIHEENNRKMNECDRELDRLKYELDYLQSEDKRANVQKSMEKIEALKKEQKQVEKKFGEETDKLVELEDSVEELKKTVQSKRAEIEAAEAEVVAAKKEQGEIDQRLHSDEKSLIQQEQIEARRTQKRHSLLHDCKIHGIEIPLISGSLDAILLNEHDSAIDDSQASTSGSQSIGSANDIEVDYSGMTKVLKKALQNETETNKMVEKLNKSVQETEANLSKMAAPSTHVNERMESVKEKEQETTEECEAARKKARKARTTFEKIKGERLKRFQDFFEPVSVKIDEIYKLLSQNASAQAFLGAQNLEEPYADGIIFSCIAPGKRFRPMDSLSGGEKTIAALALLFAIHSSNPSPFFVLDEIDAALDNTNISKVVNYINERSRTDIQLVVISLKEEMYNKADALIGVYPKSTTPCIASGVLTYDLENFNVDE